jgi:hypothetical protein
MTTTLNQPRVVGTGQHLRRDAGATTTTKTRSFSASLGLIGLIAVVISAWGGAIPYVGPLFGYSADGSPAWTWSLTHTVLALVPGVIGVIVGLSFFAPVRSSSVGRRMGMSLAGIIAIAAGAWFVIGPVAWPVISDVTHYFVPASPLRNLANQVGYSFGPGIILAVCGAFAFGWAARHNQPLGVSGTNQAVAVAPGVADEADPVQAVAPGVADEAAPVEAHPAPVVADEAAPAAANEPAPTVADDGVADDRAPVAGDDRAPVEDDDRAPVQDDDRAPVQDDDRAPVATNDPAPVPEAGSTESHGRVADTPIASPSH